MAEVETSNTGSVYDSSFQNGSNVPPTVTMSRGHVQHASLPLHTTIQEMSLPVKNVSSSMLDYPMITLTPPPLEDDSDGQWSHGLVKPKEKEVFVEAGDTPISEDEGNTITSTDSRQIQQASTVVLFGDRGPSDSEDSLIDALRGSKRKSPISLSKYPPCTRQLASPLTTLPHTPSLSTTQISSVFGCPTSGIFDNSRLTPPICCSHHFYRNPSISSEPSHSSSSLESRVSRHTNSRASLPENQFRSSQSDLQPLVRLPNVRHSMEGSLSSLRLLRAEEKAISAGIERDEARAEQRRRNSRVTVKKFAGLVRGDNDITEDRGETGSTGTASKGRHRGRMWDYMFAQTSTNEVNAAHTDELLDPVDIQAMEMLVPLREIHPAEIDRTTQILTSAGEGLIRLDMGKCGDDLQQEGTVKRKVPTNCCERRVTEKPSILFRLMDAMSLASQHPGESLPQEQSHTYFESSLEQRGNQFKSLGHKISSTLLRYLPQSRSHVDSTTSTATLNATVTISPQCTDSTDETQRRRARLKRKSSRSLWSARSSIDARTDDTTLHPLQKIYDTKRIKHKHQRVAVINTFLGVVTRGKYEKRQQSLEDLASMHTDVAWDGINGTDSWNGYSWGSERFKELGKHVTPAIGEGGLVLERDFPECCRILQRTKRSYHSLRSRSGVYPSMPTERGNISWTSVLQEFAGTLGHVRESGVRPFSDHQKGSTDSLLLTARATRQGHTLGRSNLSHSSVCLTTTEMREYEKEVDALSSIGGMNDSEGSTKKSASGELSPTYDLEENGRSETEEDEEEEEGGEGYGSNGEEGSSADEDEEGKLRALLHQVGRTYAAYGEGGKSSSATTKPRSSQEKPKQDSTMTKSSNGRVGEKGINKCNGKALSNKLNHDSGKLRESGKIASQVLTDGQVEGKAMKPTAIGPGGGCNIGSMAIGGVGVGVGENARPATAAPGLGLRADLGADAIEDEWKIESELAKTLGVSMPESAI